MPHLYMYVKCSRVYVPEADVSASTGTHPQSAPHSHHAWVAHPSGPHRSTRSHPARLVEPCLSSWWLSVEAEQGSSVGGVSTTDWGQVMDLLLSWGNIISKQYTRDRHHSVHLFPTVHMVTMYRPVAKKINLSNFQLQKPVYPDDKLYMT